MGEIKPKPPLSAFVYGEIVYWGTIVGAIIVIIGFVIAFLTQANVMDPGYVFSAIWEGKTSTEIWQKAAGSLPRGHWYIRELAKGDGLTMFGLALGIFAVIPAMLGSAIFLIKDKYHFFGVLAIIGGIITLLSFLGLFSVG